ncbi:sigma-54-dependent Fis family transcriptional regulator [Oharaeibacter diazotrophicus]|uniref:Transcriptional regulator of acetoin/glycerol metabolism n=1 Tax=Oharaeibacter diazotrophicus TaxID=1920512 RepID=A0A4V3CW48_9HYPH|nr:sigma 54-interacting transcriptional regulator [Oharaeibacter diazotrophicus]TDP84968.1 transcriptional regulator of acetoin/glycerol metabolism [Oharaeibacter diazotrophicus]BBE73937.1 acetoin catabolism regulatory protein [Pleomorphomonas sp. SM30]GLS76377.1 sigma-54-dependent Fis family transcriptional regulator [Oharaeibacter diazotrophicus]
MGHLVGIDRARTALERGDPLPAGALPDPVAESWSRCRAAGLDPRGRGRDHVLAQAEVHRRRDAIAAVRRLALAEMRLLHAQIAGSNFMIALGDADGVVLDTLSDRQFSDSAAGRAIIPGSVWTESERGTNALGLAARAGTAVSVHGREHYFANHGHLSCMAAPILAADGRVVALLDASCTDEARQHHTLVLVRMAAAQIENGLIFSAHSESHILAFHPRVEYLDTSSAGLVAVSREGEVIALNRPGATLLAGLPAGRGAAFGDVFAAGFGRTIGTLLAGGVVSIRDRAGSAVFMVCRQIGQGGAPAAGSVRPTPTLAAASERAEPDFVCADPAVRRSLRDLGAAVAMRMPVHLTGETGTGKELMARHVHRTSGRRGEFVAVNCGALPESLFVAEIFGHERGAFTGARGEGAPGLATVADKGTLFLDEVADIPPTAQTALLRFLDTMEVRAIGGRRTEVVDVQIVSATNRDLGTMVAERRFRADLLYRLDAYTIHLPPLREREDFGEIVRRLLADLAPAVTVTDAAIAVLAGRAWPGNVRELRSTLQRALLGRRGEFLDETAFLDAAPTAGGPEPCPRCRGRPLDENRCIEIRLVHARSGGNVAETARRLGLSRTTVYNHL